MAVLSLTLGIGANTAIFQLLDAVRLRALPVRPEQLVEVRLADPGPRAGNVVARYAQLTGPQWERLRADQQAFSSMLAWSPVRLNLARGGEVRNAQGIFVSGSFFEVLGVPAARGRVLGAADDLRGCGSRAAVISHAFWQREYGGDPTVVGRPIHLEGHPFDIVGVTPAGFYGVEVGRMFDVAVPICAAPEIGGEPGRLEDGFTWWLSAVGRLRPGWSVGRATAHLRTVSPALFKATTAETAGSRTGGQVPEVPARRGCLRRAASLRCARGMKHRSGCSWACLRSSCSRRAPTSRTCSWREPAPAGARWRCDWPRGPLAAASSASCCPRACCWRRSARRSAAVLARVISATLVSFLSTGRDPLFVSLESDWRVLGFAAVTAVVTTMLFGLLPALRGTSAPLEAVMRSSGRGLTSNRGRLGWQRVLVVAQVALSLVMVTGALLFASSLRNLTGLDTGFSPDDMVVVDVDFSRLGVPADRQPALHRELLDRVRSITGVISAAEVGIVPISGWSSEDELRLEGRPETRMPTKLNGVSGRYFETMRTPLVAGRDFDDRDVVGSPQVVIVNQSFARRYFGRAPALGQRLLAAHGTAAVVGGGDRRRGGGHHVRRSEEPVSADRLSGCRAGPRTRQRAERRRPVSVVAGHTPIRHREGSGRAQSADFGEFPGVSEHGSRHAPPRAPDGDPVRPLRPAGAGAVGDWHLRRVVLSRGPAPAGDWRSAGPRCDAIGHRPDGGGASRWAGSAPGSALAPCWPS